MSVWSKIWPWSKERREKERELQERFDEQLTEARERHKSLQAAADQIRDERLKRETRMSLPSHPITQE